MAPLHLEPFSAALRRVFEGPSNLAERSVPYFVCAGEPAEVLDAPDESLIARFAAMAVLCMAPKKPTRKYTLTLKTLAGDSTVMEGAWWVCSEAPDTVLFWDTELTHGLLGLLAIDGRKKSKAAIKKVLAFAKTDEREGRHVMPLDEAKRAATAY